MDGLCALVAEVFKAHGYKVTAEAALEGKSGTVYAAPLLVEGEQFALLVERRGVDELVTREMVTELGRVVEDTGADKAVFAYLGRIEDDAQDPAVVLWNADIVQELIGNAAVVPLGVPATTLPLAPKEPAPPAQAAPETLELPQAFLEDVAMEEASEPPLDLHQLDSLATGELETLANYPVAPIVIEGMVAEQKVKSQLYGATSRELVLSPIHVYEYECDLLMEGSLNYDTITGLLEVNASKEVTELGPQFHPKLAGELPPGLTEVEERAMKLNVERGQILAHEHIMEAHTRTVDVETYDEESDLSMTERKKVSPRPDQVRLQNVGTIHRPYWRIVGPNGSSLVDAVTGEVVGSELRNYDPDIVMLD